MADLAKLRSLIAHVARSRPALGKVRLFKLLYLIDFSAHAELGHSVTGEMYESFEMGPVPRTLWKRFDEITRECVIVESVQTALGIPEQQILSRDDFAVTLTTKETAIADHILAQYGGYSGNSLRDLTHKQLPYLATPRGEIIPYGLAGYLFYKRPSSTDVNSIRSNKRLMDSVRDAVKAKRARAVA